MKKFTRYIIAVLCMTVLMSCLYEGGAAAQSKSEFKVKAVKAGKATITAKYKKKKYKCSVTVRDTK